jgi:hypothetical protein
MNEDADLPRLLVPHIVRVAAAGEVMVAPGAPVLAQPGEHLGVIALLAGVEFE